MTVYLFFDDQLIPGSSEDCCVETHKMLDPTIWVHIDQGRIPYNKMVYTIGEIKDFVIAARRFDWDDENAATGSLSEDIFHALVSDAGWGLRNVSTCGLVSGFVYAPNTSVSEFMQEFISRREFVTSLQEDANIRTMLQETAHENVLVYRRVHTTRAWVYAFPDDNEEDISETVSLHIAARHNIPMQVMEVLLEAGAYVESRDAKGNTPLILLAYHSDENSKAKISLLLSYNAMVHATNQHFDTTIHVAAYHSDIKVLDKLLMNIDREECSYPLHWYNADFKVPMSPSLVYRSLPKPVPQSQCRVFLPKPTKACQSQCLSFPVKVYQSLSKPVPDFSCQHLPNPVKASA